MIEHRCGRDRLLWTLKNPDDTLYAWIENVQVAGS